MLQKLHRRFTRNGKLLRLHFHANQTYFHMKGRDLQEDSFWNRGKRLLRPVPIGFLTLFVLNWLIFVAFLWHVNCNWFIYMWQTKDFNSSLIIKCTELLHIQLELGAFGYFLFWQCIHVRAFWDWDFSHFLSICCHFAWKFSIKFYRPTRDKPLYLILSFYIIHYVIF